MSNNSDLCCKPDYEAECKRLTDALNKLKEESEYWKERFNDINRELNAAHAKLEMVYLIFGKGRC